MWGRIQAEFGEPQAMDNPRLCFAPATCRPQPVSLCGSLQLRYSVPELYTTIRAKASKMFYRTQPGRDPHKRIDPNEGGRGRWKAKGNGVTENRNAICDNCGELRRRRRAHI